ncbi:unnamed protein product [Closterium sp. Yama58-4]|nr:unnamed protein product [Closterium sp. Yama58-4]
MPFASCLAPAVCGLAAAMVSSRGDFLMWFRSGIERNITWAGHKDTHTVREGATMHPHDSISPFSSSPHPLLSPPFLPFTGIERNITWAGHKDTHTVREGATMHPRNSFAAYLEVVKLQSQPWTDAEVDAMQGLRLIVKDSLPHPEPQDLKLKIQAQLNAERLTIQSQLKEVARTLENQLESAHTPIIGISSDGTMTEFNSKAAHITRRAKTEVLGSNFFASVLAPESHAHFVAAMEVLAEGEDVQPFDVALLARSAESADAAAAADAAAGGGGGSAAAGGAGAAAGRGGGGRGGGGEGGAVGELDRLVHVLVSAYGQHDRHGNLMSVRLMGQDITALKVLAGEYKMPEAEARAAVDQSDLLVFTVDECGRVTEWNAAMEQTSGLPREKVVGRRLVGEVLSSNPMLLIPDQVRTGAADVLPVTVLVAFRRWLVGEVLSSNPMLLIPDQVRSGAADVLPGEKTVLVAFRRRLVVEDKLVTLFEAKNHELQLKTWDGRPMDTLLNIISRCSAVLCGAIVVEQSLCCVVSGGGEASSREALPTGEPVGATCFISCRCGGEERRAAENASAMKMVTEAASQARLCTQGRIEHVTPSFPRFLSSLLLPASLFPCCLPCNRRSPTGEPVGATCFMQDVVERRAAENASAMKMVAEAASQAKTMQLACLCHEIRNPLNGILSSISFMEGTDMSSDQRDLLHATSACGKYLRRVVDNVLDLSKLEEGKLEVESEPFELIHVVDAVIAQEHENASDKGLQVFCSVEPQCADVIVKGDKHRVQQIVANFFRNAVEYTEQGWVEVQLYKASGETANNEYGGDVLAGRLMRGQQSGQRTGERSGQRAGQGRNVSADGGEEEMFPFVFCVADSGPGLSEEQRQHVFSGMDPSLAPAISSGASDTESRSSAPAGSGLGLIVSQKLASLMHGTLSCDSAPSQGSSFRLSLSLPFAGRSTHADPADAGADMAAGHASLAPGGMMSCYLSNRVKGVVYTSVGVWSNAEEIAAAPVVPPSLSRNLAASGSEESATHAAAEDADVDAAALAAIVELEAAYGGRVMVQVLREVVDFREVAVLVEVGVMKEVGDNGGGENNDGAVGSNEMAIVSTQQWGSALRLGPVILPDAHCFPRTIRRVRRVRASAMAAMATLLPALSSAAVSASFSPVSSRSKSLACEPLTFSMRSLRLAVPQAAATTAPVVELAADVAEATSAVEELPLQSAEDIKAARKEEQRRKRLVQKRKLRKKGRWPPSKMKQHQNV